MKYLVLGSAGQIGDPLCNYLSEKGHDVIKFDIEHNLSQDLRKQNVLDELVQEADFVFFLAFDVGGSRYLQKYQYTYDFIDNNVKLMAYTFETLKRHEKPFIFTSSQMSNMSYSPYGILKSLGEQYTKVLNGLTVKFWNVYGYEHDLEKSHVITDFILKAKNEGEISMLTDGTELRQFLYADDCSECLEILSNAYYNIPRDKELHITNFQWNSILEVADIIADYFGDVIIKPSPSKDTVQLDKRNEPDTFIFNYWKPKTSLKEGILKICKKMKV